MNTSSLSHRSLHVGSRPSFFLRSVAVLLVGVQLAAPAWATCGGGGGGGKGGMSMNSDVADQVYQVPWRILKTGEAPPPSSLFLYWFPASVDEIKLSSLRTSRDLSLYAAQCITMVVADTKSPLWSKLTPPGKQPLAVLTDATGNVIGRVDGQDGKLKAAPVEKLVKTELTTRERGLALKLELAKTKAKAGDKAAAIEAYNSVWGERCLFPKKAKDAAKELKKLGVTVDEKSLTAIPEVTPVFDGATAVKVVATMERGLKAELAAKYDEAGAAYAEAHALDAADPTPLRYLGELYRHHTGEWAKARQIFDELLAQPADPLSRAVALHGLGKMTIHEGAFVKGMHLMEDSVSEFPLALAYRNLAVFWNSECDPEKTAVYVKLALEIDPDDTYNRIFAAVFYAASGRKEEALRIARENEALLPASYNLAAIYAQAGDPDRALALLKRHFYEYERYGAVRSEEMMEARVDEVFVSIRNDARFLQLTALADGRLPMKMSPRAVPPASRL